MEGTKDRPGNNFSLRWLKERTWNFYLQMECSKTWLINDTGVVSVKGTVVESSTATDFAFKLTGVDETMPIGIVAEDGIADGEWCPVITGGAAEVLLEDATIGTHGYWVKTSGTAGRADATLANPPAGGVAQLDEHMQEIGHSLESVGSGTDVLMAMIVHLN